MFLLELLTLILTCNYFSFNGKFYLQCRGTVMGANVAPTFANIFVAMLEKDAIYTSVHFNRVLSWMRYIDDIFLIWTGSVSELESFYGYLNSINNTVKFTLTHSTEKLAFLDTMVVIRDGTLTTELYRKPTDKNTILHFKSSHSRNVVKALPYSQFLRARRITQDEKKWGDTLEGMADDFLERGYPSQIVDKHKQEI